MPHVLLNFWVLELSTDETLEGKDCVVGVDNGLTLCWQTNETFAVFCERDHRGSCPCTLSVFNDPRRLALHNGDARICRSQIDSNHGS